MKITFLDDNANLQQKVASFLAEWNNSNGFFVTNTSGSTGKPKEISIKKEFAIQSCMNTARKLNLKKNDTALLCLDLETIGGKMMFIRSVVLNLNLYVVSPSSNPLKGIDQKIDFLAIVPLQLQTILDEIPDSIRDIKNVIVGGGSISSSLESQLKREKITVFQTFGMTETISHIALRKMGYESEEYFETLENIEISEDDSHLKINAPKIGVRDLLTNDIIELKDSHHFKWLGRADFVVNSGGIKLHPEQLHQKMEGKISKPFFFVGREDEKLGQKLIMVIESNVEEKYCEKTFYSDLGKFEIPKEVWFIENFKMTASAKINQSETVKRINESGIRKIL